MLPPDQKCKRPKRGTIARRSGQRLEHLPLINAGDICSLILYSHNTTESSIS